MTDKELEDYSADHVMYELSMLWDTGTLLVKDPASSSHLVIRNALIESFCLHARVLSIFLYPEEARRLPDDVTSEEYVEDVARWKAARGPIPKDLKIVVTRTGKEIAHLTTKRHPAGSPKKLWTPEAIAQALIRPLKLFAEHVPRERLDFSVAQYIAALPALPDLQSPAGLASTSVPIRRLFVPESGSI